MIVQKALQKWGTRGYTSFMFQGIKQFSSFNNLLTTENLPWGGIRINTAQHPDDLELFEKNLIQVVTQIKEQPIKNGIWINFPLDKSSLIPIAAKHGFIYHYASQDHLSMQLWLEKDRPKKRPQFSSHFIGVGGIVINDKDQVLLVQEKVGNLTDLWHLPGGRVDENEFLKDGVVREVFEETGIKTEFLSFVCFREQLDFRWESSDLYFVGLLKPINFEINACAVEISQAKWFDIDDNLLTLPRTNMGQNVTNRLVKLKKLRNQFEEITNNATSLRELIMYEGIKYKLFPEQKRENILYSSRLF